MHIYMCGCGKHINSTLYKKLFLYYEYNYFKIDTLTHVACQFNKKI